MQWDSADLYARLLAEIRQPSTSTVADSTACYEWLSRAQDKLFRRLSGLVPESQYGPPLLLSRPAARTVVSATTINTTTVTSASLFLPTDVGAGISGTGIPTGATILQVNTVSSVTISAAATVTGAPTLTVTPDANTVTFGSDADGNAIFPIGTVEIFPTLSAIPGGALRPGVDFLIEGRLIRGLNGQPWAGPGPYARFIRVPTKVSATVDPTLQPVQMREAMIYDAAATYYRITKDPESKAQSEADFEACYLGHLLALRVQYAAQDAQAGLGGDWNWVSGSGFGAMTPLGGA